MTSDHKDLLRFVTTKQTEVYDQSGGENYNVNKEIRIKTPMLRSDLYDFSDAYIVVEGTITVNGEANFNRINKSVTFKNNVPFINCISKINGVQTDNAEDLDVLMPMYNQREHSNNYKKATGSLWNHCRDEPSNSLSSDSESCKYKASITGKTPNNDHVLENVKVVVPLKHLRNLWRVQICH